MSDFELPKDAKFSGGPADETPQETPSDQPKSKFTQEELLAVFDELIFSGSYSEKVTIRNKLKVTFRTRTADEVSAITRAVDGISANLISTMNERRSLLTLLYALVAFQGKDVANLKLEDREKFINNLPAPIVGALISAMQRFDEKVFEACKEGEENF